MRHLIDPLDFTQQEISTLLDLADRIHDDPAAYQEVARHKKLATLFYEPSTRTRLSFEAAMLNLGGHVLGFPSENVSSASKGESVADTIRVVSCYADIVAMLHIFLISRSDRGAIFTRFLTHFIYASRSSSRFLIL